MKSDFSISSVSLAARMAQNSEFLKVMGDRIERLNERQKKNLRDMAEFNQNKSAILSTFKQISKVSSAIDNVAPSSSKEASLKK